MVDKDTTAFFEDAFKSGYDKEFVWVCPDVDQLSYLNTDQEIHARVHSCVKSQQYGTSPVYGDTECKSFDETQESFKTVSYGIFSQQITKYFDPSMEQSSDEEGSYLHYMSENYNIQPLQSDSISIEQFYYINMAQTLAYYDFIFATRPKPFTTYNYINGQSITHLTGISTQGLPYYNLQIQQGQTKNFTKWKRVYYFSDFLSKIGGLFTALLAAA